MTLAATSNTLPDRLGEGRFAADDFLREIQALSSQFAVVRIDGEDYRHRGLPTAPEPLSDGELLARAAGPDPGGPKPDRPSPDGGGQTTLDDFDGLLEHLAGLHPSRYGALLDGVGRVCLRDVRTVTDQNVALRLVVLADRLYDREIPVLASGTPLDQVFSAEMRAGGYRKKYLRAMSRLVALARPTPAG